MDENVKVAAGLTRLVLEFGTRCRRLYAEEFGELPERGRVGDWDSAAWESRCPELRDAISAWAEESDDHDESDLWEAFKSALFDDYDENA